MIKPGVDKFYCLILKSLGRENSPSIYTNRWLIICTNFYILFSEIFLNFHIVMSSVTATIQERFESGQSPSQICKLSKGLTSRSGAYKALKRFRETGSALQRISGTPDRKIRTSTLVKSSQEKISRNPQRSIRKLASASL